MSKGRFVSPNEMFKAAKDRMLNGKEPKTPEDWMRVVNFFACNIADGLELPATELMCKILHVPLKPETIKYIVGEQIKLRVREKRKRRGGNGD